MNAPIELVRKAYELLVHTYPDGLTRDQLAAKLDTTDRYARDAVNACRVLGATQPLKDGSVRIIGFDPEIKRYVAARDVHQARRLIAYQESRVEDINRGLEAQKAAYQQTFGAEYRASAQANIFDAPIPPEAAKHKRYDVSGKAFRPCRACGEPITFVESDAGKIVPVTRSGYSHFLDCPDAKSFSKQGKGAKQAEARS